MIGITSVTFRKKSVEEIISLCKKCGLDCIEWGGDIHVPPDNIKNAERVAALTEAAGMKVSSYGSYFKVGVDSIDFFSEVLNTAKALGAPVIRVWCGEKSSRETTEDVCNLYINQLKMMCELSKADGITIACEFHNNTYNDTAQSALRLLNEVNSANFKTYWQTLTFDETDLLNLKELNKNIVNIHVFSWNKQGKRYPLKRKLKLWHSYIEASRNLNANYIIEFVKNDSEKQFEKDVNTLKNML